MQDKTIYNILFERFGDNEPLGNAMCQINRLGWDHCIYWGVGGIIKLGVKHYKDGEWVTVIKYDKRGIYVELANTNLLIPYSSIKKIKLMKPL